MYKVFLLIYYGSISQYCSNNSNQYLDNYIHNTGLFTEYLN